jgi:hypothetical protein
MALLRRVEREVNGQFEPIAFADLKDGDRFKLYDDDCDDPIETGDRIYTANTDAYYAEGSTDPKDLTVGFNDADTLELA